MKLDKYLDLHSVSSDIIHIFISNFSLAGLQTH